MGVDGIHDEASAAVRDRLGALGELQPLLPAIQAAAQAHPGVYLVGGAVRDLLLGADHVDIDIAVEGDALAFADELATVLGGEVREHERFQTAVVSTESISLDVATTRTESYAEPGALPRVVAAGVGEDLARRDFTVNAMASSLKHGDLGATFDPYGGFADLGARRIRVLHEDSFRDDPTRMLRAVRYATRLDFQIDAVTLELIAVAIDAGLLEAMDSARVRDELTDLLMERSAVASLALMEATGVDRGLHPRLDVGAAARDRVARLDDFEPRLAALCTAMSSEELAVWMDRLSFPGETRDVVVAAAGQGVRLGEQLASLDRPAPSKLYELLADQAPATLAIAALHSERVGELIALYMERIAPVKLAITGDDLIAAGVPEGPDLGRALRDVLALELDGFVGGREQQLAAALRVLGRSAGGQ